MTSTLNGMNDEFPETAAYWQNLNQGRLTVPHCERCDRYFFPPAPGCPSCGSPDHLSQREVNGRGVVYSWIVAYFPFDRNFIPEVPFVIAEVQLDEGPRLYTRLLDVDVTADFANVGVIVGIRDRDGLPHLISELVAP
ncbi:OB-fold domain-containing protein [Rhodococcus sp. USK13]|uniref:Zn-ribbon domain-containing OB-fold protein n=1 Tax=Rhodococcus sp. USK13 TaxID=2806442 RepID=UPI001BCFEE4B|nr:OB-fold domain-containing protein [Rhodococcus sp. USK13]